MLPVAGEDDFGELVAADRAIASQVKCSRFRRQLFRSFFAAGRQDLRGGVGKRWRPGRTTDLIIDDPRFLAGKLEPKQTGEKAAPAPAVDPAGSEDEMRASGRADRVFAGELAPAVSVDGRRWILLGERARGAIRPVEERAAENVVGRVMHQGGTRTQRLFGEDAGRLAVHGNRQVLFLLGSVDGVVGRGIDDQRRATLANRSAQRRAVRYVDIVAGECHDIAERRQRSPQLPAGLAVAAEQQDATLASTAVSDPVSVLRHHHCRADAEGKFHLS